MDLFLSSVTYGLISLILFLFFRYYWYSKKQNEGLPFSHLIPKLVFDQLSGKIPRGVPLTSYLFEQLMEILKEGGKDGLFMTYVSRPVLFIFSEEAVKVFANEKVAMDKSPEYKLMQDVLGHGLIISNGERWKTHRKLINPSFHMGMLKDKVPLFNEHASALIRDLEKLVGKPSVDILDALKSNYFNALSESVFGLKQDKANEAENLKCFNLIDSLTHMTIEKIAYPWLRWKFLLNILPFGKEFQKQSKESKIFVTKVINDMKKRVVSNKVVETDRFSSHLQKSFTYLLLNQHLNDPSFTFQDVYDESNTILVTGYDTVTYTTLWCLFLLGLHPEIQEEVYNEIQAKTDDYVTYEDTCNLSYLEAVIMETLRIYPTVPIFARNLAEDVQYGKYKIYKDTTITFVPYLLHRNPDVYPNPENFEPDRFSNAESKRSWSFIPFSEGSRSCIGKRYAILEMKIFLAYILRNFEIITLDKREDIGLCWTISLLPSKPIQMRITPRCKTNFHE